MNEQNPPVNPQPTPEPVLPADQPPVVEPKKPERVDELDLIGGAMVRVVVGVFGKIKGIFVPKKVE